MSMKNGVNRKHFTNYESFKNVQNVRFCENYLKTLKFKKYLFIKNFEIHAQTNTISTLRFNK